ncbi:MAG: hypothetical protein EBV27_07335, partial [Actinobacteria bacterium]|nr:hypothetical protein [Actinomycetota bacterium]
MVDAILGASGFVGAHLVAHLPHAEKYNSKNLNLVEGRTFKHVYCTCIPAVKWKANSQPEEDATTIKEIKMKLMNITCDQFILISTIDVMKNEPYGKNRLEFENWAREYFNNVRVIRLPALFGIGLKKNVLFDMLTNNKVDSINLNDVYQWYDLRWLYDDIASSTGDMNLYTEPVSVREIVMNFFPHLIGKINGKPNASSYTFKPWVKTREEVLESMETFIRVWHNINKYSNLISVSSFHWQKSEDDVAFSILKLFKINKIELVPGKYTTTWAESDALKLRSYFNSNGFDIPSIQGIFWGMTDPKERLFAASRFAKVIGATKMVLGAPNFRSQLTREKFIEILCEYNGETKLCIENVPRCYGADFGHTFEDVCYLAKRSGHCVNLDLGNADAERDSCDITNELVKNIHISAKNLGNVKRGAFTCPKVSFTLEVNTGVENLNDNLYNTFSNFHEPKCLVIGAGWYGCHTAKML